MLLLLELIVAAVARLLGPKLQPVGNNHSQAHLLLELDMAVVAMLVDPKLQPAENRTSKEKGSRRNVPYM